MKLRIRDNSIRFRLTQQEVQTLKNKQIVESNTKITNQNFIYAIKRIESDEIKASFNNNRIEVTIPNFLANHWIDSEDVGLFNEQDELKIIIEKDFSCLKPREGEDDSDTYKNPNSETMVC